MSRIVCVNGVFGSAEKAVVSVFDRGFVFGDGIYEMTAVIDGKLINYPQHMIRLHEALRKIDVPCPLDESDLLRLHKELARQNSLTEGGIYIQITRGVADRDYLYEQSMQPTFVMFTQVKEMVNSGKAKTGFSIKTVPDLRWHCRDIKSISLLAQVFSKKVALDSGCDDAWMMNEDGTVTEGASSSAFIINNESRLIARPLNGDILPGTTRVTMLELANSLGIEIEYRPFTLQEAYKAKEAFNTSACGLIMPVVRIDGHPVSGGYPGSITVRLRELYIEHAQRTGIPIYTVSG